MTFQKMITIVFFRRRISFVRCMICKVHVGADCGEVEDSPEVGVDSVQSSALDHDITTCFFIIHGLFQFSSSSQPLAPLAMCGHIQRVLFWGVKICDRKFGTESSTIMKI